MTDLVLPVLLAVVAGVAATRATAAAATWWTRARRRTRSLPGFVAARAISRRQEGTLVILPVTAAIAICVFGAGVYDSAGQWRASVAATAAPAPVGVDLAAADERHRRAHPRARPRRQVADGGQPAQHARPDVHRRRRPPPGPGRLLAGPVDARHLRRPRSPTRSRSRRSCPRSPATGSGSPSTTRWTSSSDLFVRLRLDVPGDRPHFAYLGPFGPGQGSDTAATAYCRDGCQLEAITLGGPAGAPDGHEGHPRHQLARGRRRGRSPAASRAPAGSGRPDSTSEAAVDQRRRRAATRSRSGWTRRASRPSASSPPATSPRRCRSCRASTRRPPPRPAASRRPARTSSPVDPVVTAPERAVPRPERADDRLHDAHHGPDRLRAEGDRLRARPRGHARRR